MNPRELDSAMMMAVAHQRAGQFPQAEMIYREVLSQYPDQPDALHLLGVLRGQQGDRAAALEMISRALQIKPEFVDAHNNLGRFLKDENRFEEAAAAFEHAVALNPQNPYFQFNLGTAQKRLGKLEEAYQAFDRCVVLKPDLAEAHNNLGAILVEMNEPDRAIAAFRRAIALNSKLAWSQYCLANVLREGDEVDEAVALYRRAIDLQPNFPEALANLGVTLMDKGRMDDALDAFRKAVALKPSDPLTQSNLAYAVCFHPDADPPKILAEARAWSERHEQPLRSQIRPHTNDANPNRRLRIGYVSPNFRRHVVGLNIYPLLSLHDHKAFEIFCYSSTTHPDSHTDLLRAAVDHWRDIREQYDQAIADQIRADGIDILVDLALHMAHNHLPVFARKPAPVQLTYLGYCGTTGLDAIDYRFSDPYMDPPDVDPANYNERTIRLPRTYWCYYPPPAPNDTPPPFVANGFITFGCLNNFSKVSSATVNLWATILREVPASQLILHAVAGDHRAQLQSRFASLSIDPARISFVPKVSVEEYVKTHQRIDITLDTTPYGGGITTCDSLWLGVPVVTILGPLAVSRGGASILTNVGLPQFVAGNPEQYQRIAIDLAQNPEELNSMRKDLRGMMLGSPLLDGRQFAIDMESAYRQIWQTWCAGHP